MTLAMYMEPMTVAIQLPLLAQSPHPAVKPPPPDLQQHQKVNNSGVPVPGYVGVSPVPPDHKEMSYGQEEAEKGKRMGVSA